MSNKITYIYLSIFIVSISIIFYFIFQPSKTSFIDEYGTEIFNKIMNYKNDSVGGFSVETMPTGIRLFSPYATYYSIKVLQLINKETEIQKEKICNHLDKEYFNKNFVSDLTEVDTKDIYYSLKIKEEINCRETLSEKAIELLKNELKILPPYEDLNFSELIFLNKTKFYNYANILNLKYMILYSLDGVNALTSKEKEDKILEIPKSNYIFADIAILLEKWGVKDVKNYQDIDINRSITIFLSTKFLENFYNKIRTAKSLNIDVSKFNFNDAIEVIKALYGYDGFFWSLNFDGKSKINAESTYYGLQLLEWLNENKT